MRIPALGLAMAASNAGDEECGGLGARETAPSSSVDPQSVQWSSGAAGARRRDQVQPPPAPAPLGKAKPSELLRLRRKSWPSAQLQERSHPSLRSNAILPKIRRRVSDQLIIRDWSVGGAKKGKSREKKAFLAAQPSVWPSDSCVGQQTLFRMIWLASVCMRVVYT